jgi:hypothetical protein
MEAVLQGKSKLEAKRIAQYAESTSSYSIENTTIKAAFARLVRRAAPAHKLAQRIAEGIDATRENVIIAKGEVIDTQVLPDFRERREYVKLAAQYGQYVDEERGAEVNVAVGFTLINSIREPKS